jgi:hypothetical protein
MNLFSVIEKVMLKLSDIPGLRFLGEYVHDFHSRETKIQQAVSGYQGYVRAAREAGGEVANASRGSKKQEAEDDDEEYEDDVDEDEDETFMQ